jgi:two-component system, cell cycle sensor histidine kinase and response regulator CckA
MTKPESQGASSDQLARDVLGRLFEGCQVIDRDWRYVYVNDAVARQARKRREELLGRTMMECFPGIEETPMFAVLRKSMADGTQERLENEFAFPDGGTGWFELLFVPVPQGVCILSLDITEKKRGAATIAKIEEQLRHSQKMEAVGRLAGGVAHDFNNVLSVIMSYSQMLLMDLAPGAPMRGDIEEIAKAAERAAGLTRQLLAFSRQQVMEPKVLDLNELLAGMDKMLKRLLGADIDLVSLQAPKLGRVRADPGNIEQVILNLAVNARDAMPKGGKLTMETANVTLDETYARDHQGAQPGPHVMLAVTDTGSGMDSVTQSRIFEPFFTTKEKGKGTGLGLSMVFGIVKQSGGTVWVYSEVGQGTTFKVYLPRVGGAVETERPATAPKSLRGRETILLVDDDDQVRVVSRAILQKAGYAVVEARSAAEAIAYAEGHTGTIDLLLTDVVMPQMSGPELAKRLGNARPAMKLLCMSGYTDDSIVRHGVLESHIAYLQKPITPEALALRVRQVLDGDGGSAPPSSSLARSAS